MSVEQCMHMQIGGLLTVYDSGSDAKDDGSSSARGRAVSARSTSSAWRHGSSRLRPITVLLTVPLIPSRRPVSSIWVAAARPSSMPPMAAWPGAKVTSRWPACEGWDSKSLPTGTACCRQHDRVRARARTRDKGHFVAAQRTGAVCANVSSILRAELCLAGRAWPYDCQSTPKSTPLGVTGSLSACRCNIHGKCMAESNGTERNDMNFNALLQQWPNSMRIWCRFFKS